MIIASLMWHSLLLCLVPSLPWDPTHYHISRHSSSAVPGDQILPPPPFDGVTDSGGSLSEITRLVAPGNNYNSLQFSAL